MSQRPPTKQQQAKQERAAQIAAVVRFNQALKANQTYLARCAITRALLTIALDKGDITAAAKHYRTYQQRWTEQQTHKRLVGVLYLNVAGSAKRAARLPNAIVPEVALCAYIASKRMPLVRARARNMVKLLTGKDFNVAGAYDAQQRSDQLIAVQQAKRRTA